MKKYSFLITFIFIVIVEACICFGYINKISIKKTDISTINDCVKTIESNYGDEEKYPKNLSYTILDNSGKVTFAQGKETTESLVNAINNNDLMLDIVVDKEIVGKIVFENNQNKNMADIKNRLSYLLGIFLLIQISMVVGYYIYLQNRIIKPFDKLSDFAARVAEGNLDIPLDMDKGHIFGKFTESFDIMRSQLRKARIAEKKAYDDKKETIAKLSHDIKTPVASIKASSEIGYEVAGGEKEKEYFNLINIKADQVTTLVDNLFNSSVQDVVKIDVNPTAQPSVYVKTLLENADFMERIETLRLKEFRLPECMVYIDKLRLQQVFDNIITNSYKYANTKIDVMVSEDDTYLCMGIKDYGAGVKDDEIHILKEKYKRGSNTVEKEGAGLGLYLADYFMKEMGGKLELISEDGFIVKVYIRKVS